MNKQNIALILAVVAVVIATVAVFSHDSTSSKQTDKNVGGVTNYDSITLTPTVAGEGLKVGTSSSLSVINQLNSGTCTLTNYAGSFTATTTLNHNCVATGVQPGDKVFVSLPINPALGVVTVGSSGLLVVGATASTTAGNITVTLANLTGTATSSYTQATTSVVWWYVRPI